MTDFRAVQMTPHNSEASIIFATFPVMIEFPSFEQAHRWYGSEEYRELKALRLSAGRFNAVFLEGL